MPVPAPFARLTRWRTAFAVLCLACGGLVLLGCVAQVQLGLFGNESWKLPRPAKVVGDGKLFKAKLPGWAANALAEQRVIMLRKGKPVGMRVQHAKTISERGGGAYKIQHGYLYFSLPKDEDPRRDIGSLTLSLPRRVKDHVWAIGAALLLVGGVLAWRTPPALRFFSDAARRFESVPPSFLVGAVVVFGLWATVARLPDAMVCSDTWFSVKGVPYSDAGGWDEVATNLAQGRGFSGGFCAQRPLYPTMLSLVYMATGQSLLAAKALNAVWLTLAAAGVCALGIAGGSRIAGCVAAVAMLIGESYIEYSKLLMTETAGAAFGVASVLALAAAIEWPRWWRIAAAGVLLACANLASGFSMLALAGYSAVALSAWWRRQGAKKALLQSAVLAGVVLLAWMPWLYRQHAVHGIWNLTDSGANLMFSAASGEGGHLAGKAGSAWKDASVPEEPGARYRFYMAKYREAVKADPAAYAKTILNGVVLFADYWKFQGPERFGVVFIGFIAAALALLRRRKFLAVVAAAAIVIVGCGMLEGRTARVMWPLAALLTLLTCSRRQRPLWALVVLTAPFVGLLCGMTGGNLARRMWTACEWTMPLLLTVSGYGVMRILAAWLETKLGRAASESDHLPVDDGEPVGRTGYVCALIAIALVSHAVVGSMVAAGLHMIHDQNQPPAAALPASTQARAIELAKARFPFLKPIEPTDRRLWVHLCEFGEYACQLNGWEDQQHFARSFEVRPYARIVAVARLLDGIGAISCQMRTPRGALPRGAPLLVIGVLNHNPNAPLGHDLVMVEVLGFVPVRNGDAAWGEVAWLPFTRESLDILQRREAAGVNPESSFAGKEAKTSPLMQELQPKPNAPTLGDAQHDRVRPR